MPHIRRARLGYRVVVDVDDVIEHAHRSPHCLLQLLNIQLTVFDVLWQVHRAEVADSNFFFRSVQGDFGAQVG